jgi:RNA polymerase sigma-70 factor (ECF subfamily)
MSDATLLSPPTSSARDEQLNELIEKHTEPLLRAAYSIGFSEVDAEELVQDTFVAFLKARDRFEGRSKLSTYLFGILYNKAHEMRRAKDKERPEEAIEQVFDSHFDEVAHWNEPLMKELSEPERQLHAQHIGEFIQMCLDNLSMQLRIAFTMKEVNGASTSAICDLLHLTPNHLGVLLFRARNQLRECLKSKGASHT